MKRHYRVEHLTFDLSEDLIDRRIEDWLEAVHAEGWENVSLSHVDGTTFIATFRGYR